jgi:cupin 2 domain-containing protein
MESNNIFDLLPTDLDSEVFEDIVHCSTVRIERIISKGQASPEVGWYDQDHHEWVMGVTGKACLTFADGSVCDLSAGDYVHIPAHTQHRVSWTDPEQITIWLAVCYGY